MLMLRKEQNGNTTCPLPKFSPAWTSALPVLTSSFTDLFLLCLLSKLTSAYTSFCLRPLLPTTIFLPISLFSYTPMWSRTVKNTDCSTGPLARPFARSLRLLFRSLAPDCSLCSCPPLRSLVRSLPRSWVSEFVMSQNDRVLSHSALLPTPIFLPISPFAYTLFCLFSPRNVRWRRWRSQKPAILRKREKCGNCRERNYRGSCSATVLLVWLTFFSRKRTIYMLRSIEICVGILRYSLWMSRMKENGFSWSLVSKTGVFSHVIWCIYTVKYRLFLIQIYGHFRPWPGNSGIRGL